MKNSNWLSDCSEGNAAVYGEIAIITKILDLLGKDNLTGWCVEFGAGNGTSASNSRPLIEERNYSAVLIEPMEHRFKILEKLYEENATVHTLKEFVAFKGEKTLDNLLTATDIPVNFDMLSIDIDGNDYHVWKAIKKYEPKVVCIEFNQTVPPVIEFVQEANVNINQGSGLLSLYNLGKAKGYELVCVSAYNAFFVLEEYYPLFEIENNEPLVMHSAPELITYLFVGYDGEIILSGNTKMPWHSMDIDSNKLQQLPKLARKFPPNYNIFERFVFRLWRFKASPKGFVKSILNRK